MKTEPITEKWLMANGFEWFLDTVRNKDTFVKGNLRIEYNEEKEVWEAIAIKE